MSQKIDVDTKTFVRFWLVILVFVLVGVFIAKAWTGIIIVLMSIFLAIALSPLARRIDRLDRRTERKNLSSILAVVIVVLGVAIILCVTSPVIIEQVSKFLNQAPAGISNALDNMDFTGLENTLGTTDLKGQIITGIKDFSNGILSNISGIAFSSIGTIASVFSSAIFVIVLTILFMLQGPAMMASIWRFTAHKNEEATAVARRITNRLAGVISTYVSRQVLIAVLDGCVTAGLVAILGLIFKFNVGLAIPLGLISLIMYLIPMFGPIIGCILNSLILIINSPWAAAIFLVVYIIYAQIENNVIAPQIQGKGLSLSPLVIFIAITIGMYAFGLLGCIISIPIAGCIKVFIDEYPNIRALSEKS